MRMRSSVALVAALAVSTGACFPNNAHYRTIATYSEGGAILAGIAILAVAKTGADCRSEIANMPDADCQSRAETVGDIGLGLLISGLVGFIATESTAEDDSDNTPTPTPLPASAPMPGPPPAPKLPAPTLPPPPPPPAPAPPDGPAPTAPQSSIHASLKMRVGSR
ncbi:MAG TPA: hypothetical protein VGM90_10370 [Kofleriaceae bacterium]|jgi:hypothetical protein